MKIIKLIIPSKTSTVRGGPFGRLAQTNQASTETDDLPSHDFVEKAIGNMLTAPPAKGEEPDIRIYLQAVHELFNDSEIDKIKGDTYKPNLQDFGNKWLKKMEGRLQVILSKGSSEEGKEAFKMDRIDGIKICMAVDLGSSDETAYLTSDQGYLKDRISSIRAVVEKTPELMQKYRSYFVGGSSGSLVNPDIAKGKIAKIWQSVYASHLISVARVEKFINQGLEMGVQASVSIDWSTTMLKAADDIQGELGAQVPYKLREMISSAKPPITPTSAELVGFGKNLLELSVLSINVASLENKEKAQTTIDSLVKSLNTSFAETKWLRTLPDVYVKAIKNVSKAISETPPAPKKSETKEQITSIFVKVSYAVGFPESVPEDSKVHLQEEIKDFAKAYARYATEGLSADNWPSETKVEQVARAAWNALCVAAGGVNSNVDERAKLGEAVGQLQQLWPRWHDGVARINSAEGGPLETLKAKGGRRGTSNRLTFDHYEQMFWVALKKTSDLITNSVGSAKTSICSGGTNELCTAYDQLLSKVGNGSNFLATPKLVNQLFSGVSPNLLTATDFSMANDIITMYTGTNFVGVIDDQLIEQMVDSMLIQVQRWSSATGSAGSIFKWDHDWLMEDDVDAAAVAKRFNEQHSNASDWSSPRTIVFCSAFLWVLYSRASGTRM